MTVRVGILGATGAVGQRLVQLLAPHPEFEIATLAASEASAGKSYREAAKWRIDAPIPDDVAETTVVEGTPEEFPEDVPLVFSSMPSGIAERVEPAFAEAGYVVSSNSSNARLDDDVPLVVPEVNADHLGLLEVQRDDRGWDGALVKNPNCSTIAMVGPLAALSPYGLERVRVATLQAVSGAGYSGVTSMEILDNVLPHIGGEEEKMETETKKLLGVFDGAEVQHHRVDVSASCNRVPTIDGHLENVWADLSDPLAPDEAREVFAEGPSIDLPSAPDRLLQAHEDEDRPQPRLDRTAGDGMVIPVGPPQETTEGLQFDCLVHNTLRGAAGASVLNGELLVDRDLV
ncbi:aspartate-semialdehyde dehydrogenase [Halobacteriales archaeon QS_8_69_26]|nr:MAG: aspartate-semialdehyde dehydrogenase [Halobacteriales archaeon QS_8_69_26]